MKLFESALFIISDRFVYPIFDKYTNTDKNTETNTIQIQAHLGRHKLLY